MIPTDWRKTLLALAALGWAAVVLAVYYLVHKPFTAGEVQALGQPALAASGLALTVVIAHGIGGWVSRFFPPLPPRERLALQIGFGLGGLGLVMLALGAIGGYWNWLIWPMALVGSVLNGRRCLADVLKAVPVWPAVWPDRALVLFVLAALGIAFLNALTPPTAWDALVYHLTGPKLYVQAHRLVHDLDLPYLGFPQWGSMLFTWSLLLGGAVQAQLSHWLFMVLTLALLPAALRPIASGRSWLAAAVLAAVPTATLLAGWAYVEWLTMFAGLAAFVCLQNFDKTGGNAGPVFLAGTAAGLALDAKYTAAGLALGLGVWALIRLRSPRLWAVFGLGATAMLSPYLLKNWLLTGNPVYPFFLAGRYWDSFRAYWYSRPGTGLPLAAALVAPWDMTAWGVEGAELAGKVSYNATIGPLLLVLIPLAALKWRGAAAAARQSLAGLLVVGGLGYAAWAAQLLFSGLLVQGRLLFPVLPMAIVLAVAGYDGLGRLNTRVLRAQFVMGGLVAVALLLTSVSAGMDFLQKPILPVILGWQTPGDFLIERLGAYAVAIDGINQLPAGARVLFLWEPRSYYCAPSVQCEPDALLDRWWHLRRLGLTGDTIVGQWRAAGVTHVLVYELGRSIIEHERFDPLTADDWAELRSARAAHMQLVTDYFGGYQLYALK